MRNFALLVLPAALMLLGGCVSVESVHPLSPPRASVPDHRLEGMWRCGDNKSDHYMLITYRKNGTGSLMYIGTDDDGIDSFRQDFFVTHTPKRGYLNLSNAVLDMNGKVQRDHPGTYTFARYRFSWLGQLITSGAKGDAFAEAVQSGKLAGKLTRYKLKRKPKGDKEGNVADVLLTDSSDHILRFIETSKPDDIFDPESRFTKVGEK